MQASFLSMCLYNLSIQIRLEHKFDYLLALLHINGALLGIFTLNCFVLSEFKIQSCAFPLPLKLKVKYLLA